MVKCKYKLFNDINAIGVDLLLMLSTFFLLTLNMIIPKTIFLI
jgi:hypothetical protein